MIAFILGVNIARESYTGIVSRECGARKNLIDRIKPQGLYTGHVNTMAGINTVLRFEHVWFLKSIIAIQKYVSSIGTLGTVVGRSRRLLSRP